MSIILLFPLLNLHSSSFLLQSSMSDYIPAEIWPSIFQKSSPETLLRCRCVCRSWKSLISSPSFIASHLAFQIPHLIAIESNKLHEIELENNVPFHPQTLASFDFHFQLDPLSDFRIIGTVNGVICLADVFLGTTESIVLWNPLIRRCVHPPTPIHSSSNMRYTSTLGFRSDPSGTDLKIVRVARATGASMFWRRRQFPPQAEVFSTRERKWRSIEYKNANCHAFENQWSQCLLHGAVHWAAYLIWTRSVLLSFHFETEAFKLIELPTELHRGTVSVSKIGEKVAVLKYKDALSGARGCDVWAMQEYDVASSWCKMVSLDWEGGRPGSVLWVREDGGEMIVLSESENEEALCYDTSNQNANSIGIGIGIPCKGDGYFAHGFVPSLLLLQES